LAALAFFGLASAFSAFSALGSALAAFSFSAAPRMSPSDAPLSD